MLDTLKFSQRISADQLSRIPDLLESCYEKTNRETGEVNYSGDLRNLKLYTNGDWLNISGSFPKFINGNNLQNLKIGDIRRGFGELADILKIDLSGFSVRRFDVGFTFEMENHPANYLQMVRHYPRANRNSFKDGEETVQFTNSSVTIHLYDKTAEMIAKGDQIPAGFGKNQLRYEWQQKRYPERVFDRPLTVGDFQDSKVWDQLLCRYKKNYLRIGKGVSFAGVKMSELDRKVKAVCCE